MAHLVHVGSFIISFSNIINKKKKERRGNDQCVCMFCLFVCLFSSQKHSINDSILKTRL